MTTMLIQCSCGNIELEVSADPIAQFFCHCDDCQTVHGAAYVPEAVYPAGNIKIVKGEPASWTLKRHPRFFCHVCGTRLFIDVTALGLRGLNGYLLPAEKFSPQFHMQCQFAICEVHDGLKHYYARAPQFDGPEKCVDW